MTTSDTQMTVSTFTRNQEAREEKKRVRLTPIATSDFIAWLERNGHARETAMHIVKGEGQTDEQKGAHLKSIMGHGYQGRYIQWDQVITWVKSEIEHKEREQQTEDESLRRAEQGGAAYLGWDYSDEERVMMQMAAEVTPKFSVGDHVIDDTGFSGTVIGIDKAEPDRIEIEYYVRRQGWRIDEHLTKTDAPPAPISVNELLQAYQSVMDLTSNVGPQDEVWQLAHEQLRKTVARLLTPYLNE